MPNSPLLENQEEQQLIRKYLLDIEKLEKKIQEQKELNQIIQGLEWLRLPIEERKRKLIEQENQLINILKEYQKALQTIQTEIQRLNENILIEETNKELNFFQTEYKRLMVLIGEETERLRIVFNRQKLEEYRQSITEPEYKKQKEKLEQQIPSFKNSITKMHKNLITEKNKLAKFFIPELLRQEQLQEQLQKEISLYEANKEKSLNDLKIQKQEKDLLLTSKKESYINLQNKSLLLFKYKSLQEEQLKIIKEQEKLNIKFIEEQEKLELKKEQKYSLDEKINQLKLDSRIDVAGYNVTYKIKIEDITSIEKENDILNEEKNYLSENIEKLKELELEIQERINKEIIELKNLTNKKQLVEQKLTSWWCSKPLTIIFNLLTFCCFNRKKSLKNKLSILDKDITKKHETINSIEKDNTTTKESLKKHEESLISLQKNIALLITKKERASKEKKICEEKITKKETAQKQLPHAQKQLNNLVNELNEQQEIVNQLTTQLEKITERLEDIDKNKVSDSIDNQEAEITLLSDKLKEQAKKLEEQEALVQSTEQEINSLNRLILNNKQEFNQLQLESKRLEQQNLEFNKWKEMNIFEVKTLLEETQQNGIVNQLHHQTSAIQV